MFSAVEFCWSWWKLCEGQDSLIYLVLKANTQNPALWAHFVTLYCSGRQPVDRDLPVDLAVFTVDPPTLWTG